MDRPFTRDEKRFVLAEMIKASRVDVDDLVMFIRSNEIEPDWLSMPLPPGRNMNQCMQIAEHMSIPSPSLKRKQSSDHGEHTPKRRAMPDQHVHPHPAPEPFEHQAALPSAPAPVAILPRPANGSAESSPSQPAPTPKKRGRPSRADKAKRDLKPSLPPHLAPKPPQHIAGQNAPRPILPAVNPAQDQRPVTPPTAYSASAASGSLRGRKRAWPASGEGAQAARRSLSSKAGPTAAAASSCEASQRPAAEEAPAEHPPSPPGPVPIEPDPRTETRPPDGLRAALPALVDKGVTAGRMSSSHEASAPVTNSA